MSDEKINSALNEIGVMLREQPSVRTEVLRRVTEMRAQPAQSQFKRRMLGAVVGLAACLGFALVVLHQGGDRASEAFAAAIDKVAKAHTFSCKMISQDIQNDGKKDVHESVYMFKEPDRARMEYHSGFGQMDGEISIGDFTKHHKLQLNSKDKTANLEDMTSLYSVDQETGELKPQELDTDVREQVLKFTAQAVKDMGTTQLDGKTVRVLEGRKDETVRTVYLDPQTRNPVQITITWTKAPGVKYTYASIQIDQELDDNLFSLDVPQGFKLNDGGNFKRPDDYTCRMLTKARHLVTRCIEYGMKHDGAFPKDLSELKETGVSERALKTLQAAPDKPDGPAVMLYRRPRAGKDTGNEIVIYEATARNGNVVAAFADGHAQLMTQDEFEKLMK